MDLVSACSLVKGIVDQIQSVSSTAFEQTEEWHVMSDACI